MGKAAGSLQYHTIIALKANSFLTWTLLTLLTVICQFLSDGSGILSFVGVLDRGMAQVFNS